MVSIIKFSQYKTHTQNKQIKVRVGKILKLLGKKKENNYKNFINYSKKIIANLKS